MAKLVNAEHRAWLSGVSVGVSGTCLVLSAATRHGGPSAYGTAALTLTMLALAAAIFLRVTERHAREVRQRRVENLINEASPRHPRG